MTEKAKSDSTLCEQILEVRYKPNSKVLDHRGTWAQEMAQAMTMEHWGITENRIDVFNEGRKRTGFVGFRNAGYTVKDAPTKNFFPEQALKLLKVMFNLPAFDQQLHVLRIGVRSRFCTSFPNAFEDLLKRYCQRYFLLTDRAKAALNSSAKIVDVGISIYFEDDHGDFNTNSGPMRKEQVEHFFPEQDVSMDVGLYFDIDYWKQPNQPMGNRSISSLVSTYAELAWDRHEKIIELITGDI